MPQRLVDAEGAASRVRLVVVIRQMRLQSCGSAVRRAGYVRIAERTFAATCIRCGRWRGRGSSGTCVDVAVARFVDRIRFTFSVFCKQFS